MPENSGIEPVVVDRNVPLTIPSDPYIGKGQDLLHLLFAVVESLSVGAFLQEMISCFTTVVHGRLSEPEHPLALVRLTLYCFAGGPWQVSLYTKSCGA